MTLELWLAFVAATTVFLLIPGPTLLLVIGYALSYGRKPALSAVLGVALGDLVAMTVSLAGLGAVLAASAGLFTLLKWMGAAYLIYLGLKQWRRRLQAMDAIEPVPASNRILIFNAFVVTALNPKSIMFFIAFLPHFIDPAQPALPQMLILGATFWVLAILTASVYAFMSGTLGMTFRSPRFRRNVDRLGGSVLIGAGVLTAAMQRS